MTLSPDNQTQDRQRRRHRRLPRRRHARPIRRLPNLPPATGSPAPHHLRQRRRPQLHRRNHTRFIPAARQAKCQAADQVRYRARQVNPRRHRRRTLHRSLPRKRNGRRDQELQTTPPHGRRPRAPKPRPSANPPEPNRSPSVPITQINPTRIPGVPPTPTRSPSVPPAPPFVIPAKAGIHQAAHRSAIQGPETLSLLTPLHSLLSAKRPYSHPNTSSKPSSTSSKTWATDTPAT